MSMYALKVGRGGGWWLDPPGSDPVGPFLMLTDAEQWVRGNGGGLIDWGSSGVQVPDCPPNQIPMFRRINGIGWVDFLWSEEHPRA